MNFVAKPQFVDLSNGKLGWGKLKCYNKGGTPQGGQISPILANVYLHYVLDQWFEIVLKKYARGEIYYVRYADDFKVPPPI